LSDKRAGGNEVLINVAAATLAAMMVHRVWLFAVNTDKWMVLDDEFLRELCYDIGVPVGQYRSVRDPEVLPMFNIPILDRIPFVGLRLLSAYIAGKKRISCSGMIRELRRVGVWADDDLERNVDQSDKMYTTSELQ